MPLDKMAGPDAATSDQRSTARTDHENGLGEALLPCRQGGGPPQPSTIEILPERYA
jgi:hypothetical protein